MRTRILLASAVLVGFASPVWAGVGKVSSPIVTKGEFEIEHSSVRYDDTSGSSLNNKQKHVTEFEYGVTDDLKLALSTAVERESPTSTQMQEFALEAYYQFTSQGDYWLASGAELEYAHGLHHADVDAVEGKILLQRTQGPVKVVANLALEREIGAGRAPSVAVESALQGTYAVSSYANPGVEWHAAYGPLNDFHATDNQEHYVGPMVKGDLGHIGQGELNYVAGYYWGVTDASANQAARVQLGYEIGF